MATLLGLSFSYQDTFMKKKQKNQNRAEFQEGAKI